MGGPARDLGGVEGPPGSPRGVGRHSWKSRKGQEYPQRSGRDQDILLKVWEGLGGPARSLGDPRGGLQEPQVREGSRGPPGGLGVVVRPSRRSGRGHESLPKSLKGSGGPPRGPGEIGKSSCRSGRGQDVLSEVQQALAGVWEESEHPQGGLRGPYRRSWRGWEARSEV